MSKYSGKMDGTGRKGPDRRNKGVARMMREVKRSEAGARNAKTPHSRRRKLWRSLGYNRESDAKHDVRFFQNVTRPNDVDHFYGVSDEEGFALDLRDSKD